MQVTVFKSTDGKFFESFGAYKAHEEALLVNAGLAKVELNLSVAISMEGETVINVGDLADFIADNAAVLREVLNASVVAQRKGRGPNKPKEDTAA